MGSHKSWAAGDMCLCAVNLAYLIKHGELGLPSVLSAKTWGFYDGLFQGCPYGAYLMAIVLFNILYPAKFHTQMAVEAAHIIHERLRALGKSSDDIKSVHIRTQEVVIRIISKQGPLTNFADHE
jgi:2-methylcitrate dehydratase